jgi:hypothetical protein
MNKFHKLLMGTTAIVSMFGWNVNVAQAQSIPAYCTGSAIGALLGLAITGNAKAASSAIFVVLPRTKARAWQQQVHPSSTTSSY